MCRVNLCLLDMYLVSPEWCRNSWINLRRQFNVQFRASLTAKNWRLILVAIFLICLTRFNQCSAGSVPSMSTLLCTSGCRTHQPNCSINTHNVLWSVPPILRVVGNMVNTRGDDRRANDCLVYSPYNGDVHLPGKHLLCSLYRWQRHTRCCCCSQYAQLVCCE